MPSHAASAGPMALDGPNSNLLEMREPHIYGIPLTRKRGGEVVKGR